MHRSTLRPRPTLVCRRDCEIKHSSQRLFLRSVATLAVIFVVTVRNKHNVCCVSAEAFTSRLATMLKQNRSQATFERIFRFKDNPRTEDFPSAYLKFPSPTGGQEPFFLFVAETEEEGREPWTTDGTVEGTNLLKDITVGGRSFFRDGGVVDSVSGENNNFVVLPSSFRSTPYAYFTSRNLIGDDGLWRTDGSPEGTILVDSAIQAEHMIAMDSGKLYILQREWDPYDVTNWTMTILTENVETDGVSITPMGKLIGIDGSVRQGMVSLQSGSRLVMVEDENKRIIAYDTSLNEFQVIFEMSGNWVTRRNSWAVLGDNEDEIIIMSGYTYIPDTEDRGMIVRTDGTPGGTRFLSTDIRPGFRVSSDVLKGSIVMVVEDGGKNIDNNTCIGNLYKTDGTSLDFVMHLELDPASEDPTVDCPPAALGLSNVKSGKQVIIYTSDTNGMKLFVTDGTVSGTYLLDHLYPGEVIIPLYGAAIGDDNLLLIIRSPSDYPPDVWLVDSAAGTVHVVGSLPIGITRIVRTSPPFGNSLLFGARMNETYVELWRLDLPPALSSTPSADPPSVSPTVDSSSASHPYGSSRIDVSKIQTILTAGVSLLAINIYRFW